MTYKTPGLTRGDIDNHPDQNPTIHCERDQCSHTVGAREAATDDWLLDAVVEDARETVEKQADGRGRVTLGSAYADQQVRLAVLAAEPGGDE